MDGGAGEGVMEGGGWFWGYGDSERWGDVGEGFWGVGVGGFWGGGGMDGVC